MNQIYQAPIINYAIIIIVSYKDFNLLIVLFNNFTIRYLRLKDIFKCSRIFVKNLKYVNYMYELN